MVYVRYVPKLELTADHRLVQSLNHADCVPKISQDKDTSDSSLNPAPDRDCAITSPLDA